MNRLPRNIGPGPAEATAVLAALVGLELILNCVLPAPESRGGSLWATGGVRLAEIGLLLGYWKLRGWGPTALGLTGADGFRGFQVGVLTAGAMACLVGLAELGFRVFAGRSFLALVAGRGPAPDEWVPLLLIGGLVAPLFEELLFRGILYGGLRRRLPAAVAVLTVTALFAAAHLPTSQVPWVQAVGGLLFCMAYEVSGSLWAPVLIHVTGNLALFLLPLGLHLTT